MRQSRSGMPSRSCCPTAPNFTAGSTAPIGRMARRRRAVVRSRISPALVIHAVANGVLVEDVEIDAADAGGLGASSIGAIVDGSSNVVLRRVKIVAGQGGEGAGGANGAKGIDGPDVTSALTGSPAMCPAARSCAVRRRMAATIDVRLARGRGRHRHARERRIGRRSRKPARQRRASRHRQRRCEGIDRRRWRLGLPGKAGVAGAATPMTGTFTVAGYSPAPAAVGGKREATATSVKVEAEAAPATPPTCASARAAVQAAWEGAAAKEESAERGAAHRSRS